MGVEDLGEPVGMVMVPRPVFRTFTPLEAFGSLDLFQLEDAWIDYPTTDTFQEFVQKVREANKPFVDPEVLDRMRARAQIADSEVYLCK